MKYAEIAVAVEAKGGNVRVVYRGRFFTVSLCERESEYGQRRYGQKYRSQDP